MNDLQKYLVDEFVEDYTEGRLSRREALKMIGGVLGSLTLASTLLAACVPPQGATPGAGATATGATEPTGTTVPTGTTAPEATTAATEAPTAAATETTAATAEATAEATTEATAEATTEATAAATGEAGYRTNIPENDPALGEAAMVEFPSGDATVMAYLARPAGDGQFPAVLVCHENRGLTEHIKDVARRLGTSGYVALAVDLLSRQGGTASITDASEIPGLLGQSPPEQFVQDFEAGWTYLKGQPYVRTDGVGMVGFCFGGGVTWRVATKLAELKAAVPFYGPPPPVEDVPGIQAAVLAIYAGNDQRINASIETIEPAMNENGKTYEKEIYPNTDHAFHNDTGERYNAEAAQAAWARTMAWFGQYLGTA